MKGITTGTVSFWIWPSNYAVQRMTGWTLWPSYSPKKCWVWSRTAKPHVHNSWFFCIFIPITANNHSKECLPRNVFEGMSLKECLWRNVFVFSRHWTDDQVGAKPAEKSPGPSHSSTGLRFTTEISHDVARNLPSGRIPTDHRIHYRRHSPWCRWPGRLRGGH